MTDQPGYVTRDEFERRIRALEDEVEGEKLVTRHILRECQRNGDDLGALKTQVRHVANDMILVKTTLDHHGTQLNLLTQDMAALRGETTALRRDVGALREDVAAIRAAVAPRPPPAGA